MKVLIIGALPESLVNFRGPLIKAISHSCDVTALASGATADEVARIKELGANYIDYPVHRNGLNPFSDLVTLISLIKIMLIVRPNVILAYTIKPVIWGGVASKFLPSVRFYGLITGLGFTFQAGNWKRRVIRSMVIFLYRFSLSGASKVIFQNRDNLQVFVDNGIISDSKSSLVNGSGVDLSYFESIEPEHEGFVFLTVARLLGDKGLREYAAASRIVKKSYPNVVFQLLGPVDPSPDGISIDEVSQWSEYVDYLGETSDVKTFLKRCNVFVLASYHEGMPRTVLEAMAIGRPIITTDVAGCRETVINGKNGFLVEKGSVGQLVAKMTWFIENQDEIKSMSRKSRELAEEKFDVNKVNSKLLNILEIVKNKRVLND